jgi:hypothetical protein
MEQWSLAGSAIVSRIIPVLQYSNTPPLRWRLITGPLLTDYFGICISPNVWLLIPA